MNRPQAIELTRNTMRFRHMAIKTEKSYIGWLERFMVYCARHPGGTSQEKIKDSGTEKMKFGSLEANNEKVRFNFQLLLDWQNNN